MHTLTSGPTNDQTHGLGVIMKEGVILPEEHPEDPMLYKVFFGDKAATSTGELSGGIWAFNSISPFTRYKDINNNTVSYGSYTPLQPFTPVIVLMANGGLSMPIIISLAHTNVTVPDPDNKERLHVLSKSVNGSAVMIDDKTGHVHLMHNHGEANVVLADDLISLEITDGNNSGKVKNSTFTMNRGNFTWRMKDATLSFNESGFYIGFDKEGSSYVKVTEDGIELYGSQFIKNAAKESISNKAEMFKAEGIKDVSIKGRYVKVTGDQLLTFISGQILLHGKFSVTTRSLHIAQYADVLHRTTAPLRWANIDDVDYTYAKSDVNLSLKHTISSGAAAVAAGVVSHDGCPINCEEVAIAQAIAEVPPGLIEVVTAQEVSEELGKTMAKDTEVMAVFHAMLVKTMGGVAEPANKPSGNAGVAVDKKQKNSIGSVASTYFSKTTRGMDSLAVVSPLVAEATTSFHVAKVYGIAESKAIVKDIFNWGTSETNATVPSDPFWNVGMGSKPNPSIKQKRSQIHNALTSKF